MGYQEMFQFVHLVLPPDDAPALVEDQKRMLTMSKLCKEAMEEWQHSELPTILYGSTFADIIARMAYEVELFFNETRDLSDEEIEALKGAFKFERPVPQPNRAQKRAMGLGAPRKIKGRYVNGEWQGDEEMN